MKEYKLLLEFFLQRLKNYNDSLRLSRPAELYDPEIYILNLGGKRIRPLLSLVACDLFDEKPAVALDTAMAVELFHNFSLIHDDILDAAPLRRNQPTVHTKWNNNIAILSGDVMLVKAFKVLENYEPEVFKKLFSIFSSTAIEVCEGQQLDMNFETMDNVSVDAYITMIRKKTAVLLGCSLQMGAVAASASTADQEHLFEFGKDLGIAFQLLDDSLDAYAPDSGNFGKQVGGDIIANKKTFLLLKAKELGTPEHKDALSNLSRKTDQGAKVKETLAIFNELGIKDLCNQEANRYTESAIASLEKVKASPKKKEQLKNFALELLNRQV